MARVERTPRNEPKGGKPASSGGGKRLTLFEQHQATAVDSLLRLLADPLPSFLTWAVIAIALSLPLSLLLLLQNLNQLGSGIDQVSTLSLYMAQDLAPGELDTLAASLAERSDIAQVDMITPDDALAEFQAQSGFGDALLGLDENPLPPVLLVTPLDSAPEAVTALHSYLSTLPGVEHAQLDLEWLQRLGAIIRLATRMAVLLAVMLGCGVILAIGNTVRLAIENRRAEIVVVKLVGGTDAYVARPFLYTGLWYGAGGGLLAVIFIALVLLGLRGPLANLMGAYDSSFVLTGLGIANGFLVLVGAGLLGWLGAWLSVLRHLRAIEPR